MSDGRLERWVRPEIRALSAYHVPDASGLIKLDAMENPWPLPGDLRQTIAARLAEVPVNRYPDPQATALGQAIRALWQIPDDVGMLFGNGSDELIQLIAMVLGGPGRTLLSVEPGFVMYRMIATFTQSRYVGVDLRPDFSLDTEAVLAAIRLHEPAVCFLACPNNPTGNLFDADALRAIVEASPGYVVIDEAYTAFTDADHLDWINRHENVLVMRTLSKVGLAGLRLGMLFGRPELIEEINKVRLPYNINVLTQTAARLAVEQFAVLETQTRQLRASRDTMLDALAALPGVEPFPSQANFVLVRVPDAPAWFAGLKAGGILVKNLHGAHPLLAHCLRLTVGAPEENDTLLSALEALARG